MQHNFKMLMACTIIKEKSYLVIAIYVFFPYFLVRSYHVHVLFLCDLACFHGLFPHGHVLVFASRGFCFFYVQCPVC